MFDSLSTKTCRRLLVILSVILVCVLSVQCLYLSGVFPAGSRTAAGEGTPSSETAMAEAALSETKTGETALPETKTGETALSETGAGETTLPETETEEAVPGSLSRPGYTLQQVVTLSRHNIRSPLSGPDSILAALTPHDWFAWSSNPSELSLRGGVLETEMGQYFRKWLEVEGLFPENYHPDENAVRVYANSKQRTIATARYFSAGLLPTANTQVEYHAEFDKMDPVFNPQITFVTPSYAADAEEQIRSLYTDTIAGLEDNYALISDVLDMEQSKAKEDGTVLPLRTDDLELVLEENQEPGMRGSLKTACSVSDALILQYYEEADQQKAAFGHDLTQEEWTAVSEIKDVYGDVLFTAPLVAANVAHPLLLEIQSELSTAGRAFTFLCGHDSNIGSVLAALDAEAYELPCAIEKKTPIGCKLVFTRWTGSDGAKYCGLNLVYQSVEQLHSQPILDLNVHPVVVSIALTGLNANADGLYPESEFLSRLSQAIGAYDQIVETYSDVLAPAA